MVASHYDGDIDDRDGRRGGICRVPNTTQRDDRYRNRDGKRPSWQNGARLRMPCATTAIRSHDRTRHTLCTRMGSGRK